jgi:hypothetical protein
MKKLVIESLIEEMRDWSEFEGRNFSDKSFDKAAASKFQHGLVGLIQDAIDNGADTNSMVSDLQYSIGAIKAGHFEEKPESTSFKRDDTY